MRVVATSFGIALTCVAGWVVANPNYSSPVGAQPKQSPAALNYLLHCQGCHQADGSGRAGYIPAFRGSVARFLHAPEGRAYLARVPGTAQSLLNDRERAEVLNWIVATFDPGNQPLDSAPYTAAELARYRLDPLSAPTAERTRVLALLADNDAKPAARLADNNVQQLAKSNETPTSTSAPAQFAVCAACHPTSADGSSAMGPNLRGVVDRKAGTLTGFAYSRAMRESGIVWTRAELDAFLADVPKRVPGTLMAFASLPSAADRAAVIDYLQTLD